MCKSGIVINELQWLADDMKDNGSSTKKTIIYSPSVTGCMAVYDFLMDSLREKAFRNGNRNSFRDRLIQVYYADVGPSTKRYIQNDFPLKDSVTRILIATTAFGVGVDIPDVSRVVHWGISRNALCYWQEVGRAGRNGEQAEGYLYVVPKLFSCKGTDPNFITKMKELGGLKVRERGKARTRGTQTEDAKCANVTTDEEEEVIKGCLRRTILEELVVPPMKQLQTLEELRCTGLKDNCPLGRCCTLCQERCSC